MNKNQERGKATRAQFIEIATRLFASRGYEATSIEAVLAESGASRGSLYHHFRNKEALFLAVMEDAGAKATAPAAKAISAAAGPVEALRIACLAWVRLAGDPVVRQIMLIDAPAVLGWQRWRELDEQGPLGAFRDLFVAVARAGHLDARYADPFAHIVLAALNELTLMIANAENQAEALATSEKALEEFLDRLIGSDT